MNEPSQAIDIGGIEINRTALAEAVPDPARFEHHLPDALAVDAAMRDNDGEIPAFVRAWPPARIEAVVATLKEVGNLRVRAQRELASTDAAGAGEKLAGEVFRRSKS